MSVSLNRASAHIEDLQGHPRSWFWHQSKARRWLPISPQWSYLPRFSLSEKLFTPRSTFSWP